MFLLLFFHLNTFAQQNKGVRIEFLADQDSFPDCRTLFYANGQYTLPNLELIKTDIPNTIPINPSKLAWDSLLIFHSFSLEAKKLGSLQFDEVQVIPYTYNEVRELILASKDSSNCDWLIRDEDYLRKTFGIVYDAESLSVSEPVQTQEPIITNGILDGVYIDERQFVRVEPLDLSRISIDYYYRSFRLGNQQIQPKIDSLLRPFYFSNYEVTNKQYRQFVNWVADSIELHMAYFNLSGKDALLLLDCSNKERKSLDTIQKQEYLLRFGLTRKHQKKISEENWVKSTMELFYPQPQRYYKRREKDTRVFIYQQSRMKSVSVYPDTSGFYNIEFGIGNAGVYFGNMTWHPAYRNYPVTNVSREQIMAYCHWRQRRINEVMKSEGYKITVRPPTITEYEFATKTSLGPAGYYSALDQGNDKFITNNRIKTGFEYSFYKSVLYNPLIRYKERKEWHVPDLNYKQWYLANKSESPVKFLNGNVSEFVLDEITPEAWEHYRINQVYPETQANFVLGSNYKTDVKTISDDQYNAIFYKSILENGKSSPLIGFRVIYFIEKL